MFHPHENFNSYHYFWPAPKLCKADSHDLCQSLTHVTHKPVYQHYPRHTGYLAMVYLMVYQWFIYSGISPQIFSLNIFEILRTCAGWWLPNLSKQTKSIHKVGNILKNFLIIISRHTAWLEDSEANDFQGKGVFKYLVKFVRKHLYRCLLLNKVAGWKHTNSSNTDSGTSVFL